MSTDKTPDKTPERTFMHDISTPIAVALGMVDLVVDDATSGVTPLPEAAQKRMIKAQTALLKLQEMIAARRKVLLA